MESIERWPDRIGAAATPPNSNENTRLDLAMQKADDLLFNSLKQDESRRRRRMVFWTGVSIALAIVAVVVVLIIHFAASLPTANISASSPQSLDASELTTNGWQLWQHQQYVDAADVFSQAVKINPQLTNAWNGLGWSRLNSGDSDGALAAFQKVLALEPTHPAALNGVGQIYFSRSEFDKAEPVLLKAAPNASASWWALAKLYLLESDWSRAEKYAQMIVDSGQVTGPDLAGVNAMLAAARNQALPNDLREKIAPPSYMASHVKSAPSIEALAMEGGGIPVPFVIVSKQFTAGDNILISDIHGTASTFTPGNIYCIKGNYTLTSQETARLAASSTAKYASQGIIAWAKNQTVNIAKGAGPFTLYFPVSVEGLPHLIMYGKGGGFNDVYFGTSDTLKK
jgi:Tetratricopeptide repeat